MSGSINDDVIDNDPIDGPSFGGLYLYLTALLSGASSTLGVNGVLEILFLLSTPGTSILFTVTPDDGTFIVAPDPGAFVVSA